MYLDDKSWPETHKYSEWVKRQLEAGLPKDLIEANLRDRGVSAENAKVLIEEVKIEASYQYQKPPEERPLILKPLLASIIAALLGSSVWIIISLVSKQEYTFLANIMGFCAAVGALEYSSQQREWTIHFIAGLASAIGFLFGKATILLYSNQGAIAGNILSTRINFEKIDLVWLLSTIIVAVYWTRKEMAIRA